MSLETLLDKYYTTVGRNTNMLIGVVVDTDGLVPDVDAKRMKAFGDVIKKRFDHPIARTQGKGNDVLLKLSQPTTINQVVLAEDIAQGERVREFSVEGRVNGQWQVLYQGTCIGHKHIIQLEDTKASAVRLLVTKSADTPLIRDLSVYHIQ